MAIFLDCSRGATFFYVRGRADLVAGRSLRFVRRRGHIDHTLSRCQREHSTRGRHGRRRTRQATQPWFVEASLSISDFSLDATMRPLRSWATEHTIKPMFSTLFPADIRTSVSSFLDATEPCWDQPQRPLRPSGIRTFVQSINMGA